MSKYHIIDRINLDTYVSLKKYRDMRIHIITPTEAYVIICS